MLNLPCKSRPVLPPLCHRFHFPRQDKCFREEGVRNPAYWETNRLQRRLEAKKLGRLNAEGALEPRSARGVTSGTKAVFQPSEGLAQTLKQLRPAVTAPKPVILPASRLDFAGFIKGYCGCDKCSCHAISAVDPREAAGYTFQPKPRDVSTVSLPSDSGIHQV